MAQSEEARRSQKRGASRPTRAEQQRAEKKRKISTTNVSTPLSSSAVQSPIESSPAPEKRPIKLPPKISDHKPLPTLSEPQAASLSSDEYQSIAASGVLQASLDRSRLRWVHDGVLERYWVKPESGKNARPPPPNNPELKWQKHKGPCRIRIEPHIFEAEVYVEEKAKPPPPPPAPKQYVPPPGYPQQSAYGQPYRQGQHPSPYAQAQQPYYQNRPMPPMQQPAHGHPPPNPLPAMGNMPPPAPAPPQSSPPQGQQQSPPPTAQDKKASPDPVISMLASRASSDPELKALMKEVATGSATQDQLKVFQNHIDELTKLISDKKKKEEEEAAAAEAAAKTSAQMGGDVIQYDGANDPNVHHPATAYQQQRPYQPPYQPHPHPHPHAHPHQHHPPPSQQWQPPPPPPQPPPPPPQPPAPPPAPVSHPVILAFTTPGATEDRFLFPQSCILESLSPQHLLASFIVTRKASQVVDPRALPLHVRAERDKEALKDEGEKEKENGKERGAEGKEKDTEKEKEKDKDVGEDEVEFWQPITLMVEVAYNREHIIDCVRRWVKPAEEVKKEMEAVMARCVRAEELFLAMRLPVKGSVMAEVEDSSGADVVAAVEERKGVRGPNKKKAAKKEGEKEGEKEKGKVDVKEEGGGGGGGGGEKAVEKAVDAEPTAQPPPPAVTETPTEVNGGGAVKDVAEPSTDAPAAPETEATETGRPRRATRKSVRISEA